MNIQSMLDRLQYDLSRIHGIQIPRLDSARVPHYEVLWRELLVLIENIGDDNVLGVQTNAGPSEFQIIWDNSGHAMVGKQGVLTFECFLVWCGKLVPLKGHYLIVPRELAALVNAFLGTQNSGLLRAIRQVCLLTYKSRSNEITQTQTDMAIAGFIERNARCQRLSEDHYRHKSAGSDDVSQTLRIARLLWRMVTTRWDFRDIKPSHGPGAVSDAKAGISKWKEIDQRTTRLIDKLYPVSEYFCPSLGMYDYNTASLAPSGHAKLAIVPKDKRGPRIICTQPSSVMWIQQGQRRNLEYTIESSHLLRCTLQGCTSSSIKFDNQEQNGGLALESSRTREFATIDLRDASDLVSWGLIRYLSNKEVSLALACSRTTHVRLPNNELVKLHMYAPMGSAMCFPVESLVFWTIATAAMHVCSGVKYEDICRRPRAFKALTSVGSSVFVFGDDVIVKREFCNVVCERYRDLGFVPNVAKTFAEGFYRESCGVDAFRGDRLDICRLQVNTITSMPEAYASIELCRRARGMGLVTFSEYLEAQVESYLGFGLAVGNYGGPLWDRNYSCDRWGAQSALQWNIAHRRRIRYCYRTQCWYAWSIIARPRTEKVPQDGRYRLFRGLTTGVSEHTMDWLSPDSSQYYLGWVRAF